MGNNAHKNACKILSSISFAKILNMNWQKVWAGGGSVLEFIVQTHSLRCIQLTFKLISAVSTIIGIEDLNLENLI